MSFKLAEEIYILNGVNGEIMKSTYGGKCWQEELGLISKDPETLRKWYDLIKEQKLNEIDKEK